MVARSWRWGLAAVFVAIVMVGVSVVHPAGRNAGTSEWTLMVYLIGDTDLEPYALDDIAEMASVGSTDDVNIVALVDRSGDYSSDPAVDLADWEDTVTVRVEKEHLRVIDEPGESNLGDPATLADFVDSTAERFPASHYGLVLWDHGAGWPGMGPDETDGMDVLDLAELDAGLTAGLGRAGIDALDFVGFDACLMSTYEVASVIASHADYMVGSEELEPGHGWDYRQLSVLTENPRATPTELGAAVIDGYAAGAEQAGTEGDITLAMLDLGAMAGVQGAVTRLAELYEDDPDGLGPTIAAAQNDVPEFGRNPDPGLASNQIDLGAYVQNLAKRGAPDVAAAAEEVTAALDALVIDETAGPAMSSASGLSIYFPETEEYLSPDYLTLDDVPAWPRALSAFFESGGRLADDMRARFAEGADAARVSFGDDGATITASLPAAAASAVVSSRVSAGYRDGDDIVYVAELPAPLSLSDSAASVSATYDLTVLTLGDGDTTVTAYQDITTDPTTGYRTIDVPLEYVAAGDDDAQDALLSLVVDPEGTVLEEDFYVLDDAGTYGAMSPDPDARIFPVALVLVDDEDWEYQRTDETGIAADLPSIEYALEPLPSGTTLVLDADVQDYGQEADTVSVEATIPD